MYCLLYSDNWPVQNNALKKKQDFIASIIYIVQTKAMFCFCMCDSVCVMLFHQINKSTCSYTWQLIEAIKRIDLDKVKD